MFGSIGKKIVAVVGVILIGALGSGLWDLFLKQEFLYFGSFALNISTFGISSYRDSIYADISQGHADHASMLILSFCYGALLAVCISISIDAYRILYTEISHVDQKARRERGRKYFPYLILILYMGVGVLTIMGFKTIFVMDVTSYIDQLENIASPFISENERLTFISRIARAKSRSEIVGIIDDLKLIAKNNNINPPVAILM